MKKIDHKKFFEIAIKEAIKGINKGDGGPFGAVIVKDGKIIAKAHNKVLKTNDPTAHAEIVAIRKASKKLNRFDLSDCVIYSTCEPCPMCLAAIYWAKIRKLYYICTREDAAEIGFDDNYIYEAVCEKDREGRLKRIKVENSSCKELFSLWKRKDDKTQY